jgi:hypothetical protein
MVAGILGAVGLQAIYVTMKTKKLFTCSTQIFESLKEAEDQLDLWSDQGKLNPDTRVYEIKMNGDVPIEYYPKIKLEKVENI